MNKFLGMLKRTMGVHTVMLVGFERGESMATMV